MRIRNLIYFTLLFLGALQASIAQERTISGVVKDENQEPFVFAKSRLLQGGRLVSSITEWKR